MAEHVESPYVGGNRVVDDDHVRGLVVDAFPGSMVDAPVMRALAGRAPAFRWPALRPDLQDLSGHEPEQREGRASTRR
ncbi:MAG TPA: hypothetical protein VIV06_07635 [Candidatus Limnocylindrales bacterium]